MFPSHCFFSFRGAQQPAPAGRAPAAARPNFHSRECLSGARPPLAYSSGVLVRAAQTCVPCRCNHLRRRGRRAADALPAGAAVGAEFVLSESNVTLAACPQSHAPPALPFSLFLSLPDPFRRCCLACQLAPYTTACRPAGAGPRRPGLPPACRTHWLADHLWVGSCIILPTTLVGASRIAHRPIRYFCGSAGYLSRV